mgnify:CR=1 FL=1
MLDRMRFAPAAVLGLGCLMMLSVQAQQTLELQKPLTELPDPVPGFTHKDFPVPDDQVAVAGMTSYVNRVFLEDSAEVYGLYVGFYDSQRQGKTVHSPKNCLPGAGWEPMASGRRVLSLPGGDVEVNRYLIVNQGNQALVYYWYQGRGRVAANEYKVKWDLLRDAAIRRRTDEALVRIVIPVTPARSLEEADRLAEQSAAGLIPTLFEFLPA